MSKYLKCKTAFISDSHIGMPYSNIKALNEVVRKLRCEKLYLNGDIFDKDWFHRNTSFKKNWTRFIKQILKKAEHGCEVYYLPGNHDDFLQPLLPMSIPNLKFSKEFIHKYDDMKYLVTHGDVFDRYVPNWMYYLGGMAYFVVLNINSLYNNYRKWRGKSRYSISKKIKNNTKYAVNYISKFEKRISELANAKNCDGVICGHIHKPQIRNINGVIYLNSGDWIDHNSILIQEESGKWKHLYFDDEGKRKK